MTPAFVARWDLDKTYLRTDFETLGDLVRTAFEPPEQKRTVPGARTLLTEIGHAGAEVHILSGSPRQMKGKIVAKLSLDGVRFDSLTLKPNLANILRLRFRALRDQLGYKLPSLLRSRASGGDRVSPEILLGDDAEADAFVYSLYADLCAGRVGLDLLREVMRRGGAYPDTITDAVALARGMQKRDVVRRILIHLDRQTRPSRFSPLGRRVVPFYNYLQAACVLVEEELLPAESVIRVAEEFVRAHRFDGLALSRSYLELARRGFARGSLPKRLAGLSSGEVAVREMIARLAEADVPPPSTKLDDLPDYLELAQRHNPRAH